jgi:cytochrome c biogenesis factor
MENQDNGNLLLKKVSLKLALLMVISSVLGLMVFQVMHLIGWPETVKWFFGAFIWIFIFLIGFFNILNGKTGN